ncbi:hypothetical protein OJF2_42000 [Aquisphaera giovannonii]|uniref:Gfo/Idh/MocA-like oxidoreductase N-terminal domain-containing protein n=1 Tax=Aquisphaera giovannonii TaxID=406548 RepID=A0A5B9W691_9BACT|nr:hypothetical protein [Aquisphaera giovannonii]QEH35645.1 hypothetical protein OJF2_42000 [Aquisphaera giovannonii]
MITPPASRRRFLESTAAGMMLAPALGASRTEDPPRRPKVAALASTYFYLSHAYHIVGRFLDGFPHYAGGPAAEGRGDSLHRPGFDVASLYIEQASDATDLGRAKAKAYGVRLSPTIEDALTLGTGKLAVDAVLLIAEHGDYPLNEKLQKLYPRGAYFRKVLDVFRASGKVAPVFIDKHLSYSRAEGQQMVDQARALGVPLMAGSSLPVTWRLPELEIPLGRPFREVLVASRGNLEIFGFHALETLQCMAERRDRKGKTQGVKSVTYLEGPEVWEAGDKGLWSWDLLRHALGRSHTVNPGDVRQNCRDFATPSVRDASTILRGPNAFVVEYEDGLRATAMILNGHVDDTTVAVRTRDSQGRETIASTLTYLPAPPGARFFDPLVLRIEDFFRSGKPPYPVERTLLTGGILDAALDSRIRGHAPVATPELAAIDYEAPADSGFIRTPLTDPTPNRL